MSHETVHQWQGSSLCLNGPLFLLHVQGEFPAVCELVRSHFKAILGERTPSEFACQGAAPLAERTDFLSYVWSRLASIPELAGITEADLDEILAILKQLTWCYVIEAPGLAVQQHAQGQIIRYLFNVFMHETNIKGSRLLPAYYRERLADVVKQYGSGTIANRRVVVDLIAGMTESQAYAVYQRLNGIVSGSALDKVLV